MSDIFISYASEDREQVRPLARALEQKGWSVWWDRRIPVGRSYDEVIEEALDGSKSVVVVWTKTSVKSQWVKNEAREGLRRRVLFPVMLLEEVKIPLEFRDVQAAQLMGWQPGREHHGFDQFVEDLTQVIGAPSSPGLQSTPEIQKEEPVSPTSTPEPDRASPRESASEVTPERQPERRRPQLSGATAGAVNADTRTGPVESQGVPRIDQESAQVGEGQSSEQTGTVQSTDSFPYLPIGLGALVAIGALIYSLSVLQGPRPVPSDAVPYQSPAQSLSPRMAETSPSPAPESITQPSAATTTEKPIVRQAAGPAKTITGKDGAPMVLVQAGSFLMGSTKDEVDRVIKDCIKELGKDQQTCEGWYIPELPQHKVSISSFYLDQYEVTNRLFARFIEDIGYRTTAEKEGSAKGLVNGEWKDVAGATWKQPESGVTVFASNRAEHPVVSVSWEDANAYCRWAGKRLPTEAEFEYATRAGTQTKYWWGNGPPGTRKVANIADEFLNEKDPGWAIMAGYNDGYERTAPVGSFKENPFRLFDMTGNVNEWTSDWYGANYYGSSQAKNPKGPSNGEYRVLRGGSWDYVPVNVRSANRTRLLPTARIDDIGFRCTQDIQ